MEIKRTLDHMPRLVFWRIDEALMLIIPFALGVLFGSLSIIIGAFFSGWFYKKIRKRWKEINIRALIYWIFGTGFSQIPSHMRKIRR